MADITFTTTAVLEGTGAVTQWGIAGGTVSRGNAVYQKAADTYFYIADCTTSSATAAAVGFALNDATAGQPLKIQTGGNLTCTGLGISAAASKGVYVLSEAGLIAPAADLAASDYVTFVGVATSATNLKIGIVSNGVVLTA